MKTNISLFYNAAISATMILLMAFVMVSCEDFFISDAQNVDIPGSEPQLVVNSYISPQDTLIRVFVNRSVPYTQKPSNHIPVNGNADVYMARKGEAFLKLEYSNQFNCFVLDAAALNVEANNSYMLKVETHDGDYAEAECFVPGIQIAEMNISKPVSTTNEWGDFITVVEWSFKVEGQGGEKYFRIGGYKIAYDYYEVDGEIFVLEEYIEEMSMEKGTPFVHDKSGSIYSFQAHTWTPSYDPGYPDYPQKDSMFIFVIQSDFNYYRFHTSVDDYFYYDDGFPFAESVRIYSNVKNALGTFGGYNRQKFYVRK